MSKLVVLSDSHGNPDSITVILKTIKTFDAVIFCGDGLKDFAFIDLPEGVRTLFVPGNIDRGHPIYDEELVVEELFGIKCAVTHGHNYQVKSSLGGLAKLAQEVDLLCFGHTHCQYLKKSEETVVVNPGVCAIGEFALITINRSSIDVELRKIDIE